MTNLKNHYSSTRIRLHIDVEEAIDLVDLSSTLLSINSQYNKYLRTTAKDSSASLNAEDTHLFITRIENKCIEAEIAGATATFLGAALPLLEYHNTFRGFVDYFAGYIKAFRDRSFEKDPTKTDCTDYSNFLVAASKSPKGAVEIDLIHYENDSEKPKTEIRYRFASEEVVRARQNALALASPEIQNDNSSLKFQTLYFPQINAEESMAHSTGARSHDRGVIQNVSKRALPVFWASEMDSQKVKSYSGNPFKASYIVDVNVGYKGQNPTHYTVVHLHTIVQDPDSKEEDLLLS